jgi:hypothetical protein
MTKHIKKSMQNSARKKIKLSTYPKINTALKMK